MHDGAAVAAARARRGAVGLGARARFRVVNSSQLSFAVTCGSGFYAPDFPTLGVAPPGSPTAFLPPELSSGASFLKQGYSFTMTGTVLAGAPPTCNGKPAGSVAPGYAVIADPLDPVGNPHFYGSNADGTIYLHNSTLSGVDARVRPSGRAGIASVKYNQRLNLIPYGPPKGEDPCVCTDSAR